MVDSMRQVLEELKESLARQGKHLSQQEQEAFAVRLRRTVDVLEGRIRTLTWAQEELDTRLLRIENSRFLRLLQMPGRLLLVSKRRLGRYILHSRLHPLFLRLVKPQTPRDRYQLWLQRETAPVVKPLNRQPLISVVMPVYKPNRQWLEIAVDSVLNQTYGNWQLCVCDDASGCPWITDYFEQKATIDPRIRFVRSAVNLGISGASNRAGEMATGEYIGFLDQDDSLAPFALYCVAEAVQHHLPELLYSDEDCIEAAESRVQPVFKPGFSPDLLRCCMYMGHFLVVRKDRLEEVGWLRQAYDGSQDYDLVLRVLGGDVREPSVVHIPRILYHWRKHPGSTASSPAAKPYSDVAGFTAVAGAVSLVDRCAVVEHGRVSNTYRVRWPLHAGVKASLIICSRDATLLRRCLRAIENDTQYSNREIIVVEHRIGKNATMDSAFATAATVRVCYHGNFNYAVMNNLGAARASGDVFIFVNDDVEPLTPAWLSELLAHAVRREVGAVGAHLLYPSGATQHAGIVIGTRGSAWHLCRNMFAADYWQWLPFTRNVSAVTGACLAMRKDVFRQLRGFDPCFPINYNDIDLCLRARAAGYEIVLEPSALLRHYESQSRQPVVRLAERRMWEERWSKVLELGDPYYTPHLTRDCEEGGFDWEAEKNLAPRVSPWRVRPSLSTERSDISSV